MKQASPTPTKNNYAYATFVSTANYLEGLMALWLGLRATGTEYPLYALLPTTLIASHGREVKNLKKEGIHIIEYPHAVTIPATIVSDNANSDNPRFSHTYDKLLVFELTQFDKVVYIDTDVYVLQSLDSLFEMPHMSAVVSGRSYPGNEDWVDLTSGIMTIVPQAGLLTRLLETVTSLDDNKRVLGDQGILQSYYADWPQHPELDMGEKYGILSYYADYYERHLGYHYDSNRLEDPRSVAVLHFATEHKPWMSSWSPLAVAKQELTLIYHRLVHRRSTATVLLEYKRLVRCARCLLYR